MGSALKTLNFGLFGALMLASTAARADDTDDARELSKQGYELFLADKCDEAIPILERSAQLVPDARTLVNLGRCEDKSKRLLAARGHYDAARDLARAKLTPEMVAQLDTMIAELEQKIPHVKIVVAPGAPSDTIVKHGGVELRREADVAVDPGDASFAVSASGHEPKTFTVTLAEGETKTLEVAPGTRIEPPRPVIEPTSSEPHRVPWKTVGAITMIAGAGAIALGGVFGAIAIGKKNHAEDAGCMDRLCPDGNAGNLRDDAKVAGTVSTIAFLGGGVLAAAGLGIFLLAPSASHDRVGLTMSGHF